MNERRTGRRSCLPGAFRTAPTTPARCLRGRGPSIQKCRPSPVPFRSSRTSPELRHRFDGVLCIDTLENVGPEDWPTALHSLRSTCKTRAYAYLTVEIPEGDAQSNCADEIRALLVPGEVLRDGAYHYFPSRSDVEAWLADSGFQVLETADGDGYMHFLCQVTHA